MNGVKDNNSDNASTVSNRLGLIIAFYRKAKKYTQESLGEEISKREGKPVHGDAARVLVSKIENNVNKPSDERIAIICDILEISPNEIEPMVDSMDAYVETMSELTSICSKLSDKALKAVLEYARQFAEREFLTSLKD